jgi:DNA polymerase-3 subunit gamma/tau
MMDELYKKHRPTKFSGVVGQSTSVRTLVEFGKRGSMPHFLLFTGPSGTGKTTVARILKGKLRCSDWDFIELNCAGDARGIDTVRQINEQVSSSPMGGKSRIWLLDEAGKLTPDAQTALLKTLEDTPDHAYFILCTTDPQKLIKTLHTRATTVKFEPIKATDLALLLDSVAGKEGMKLSVEVRDKIVEAADGSARMALVILNQIVGVEGEEDRLATVSASGGTSVAIDIARALIKPGVQWGIVSKLLKECTDEPETVRRVVLGYFASVLIGGGRLAGRAFDVICIFERNFFDGGRASLAAACWQAVGGK